ncbi:MAG: type II secretion system protein [Candidatus Omnitrophica bacterium]|nr:type II secretion system protein [Candidatus Omnitrophota bacterium]
MPKNLRRSSSRAFTLMEVLMVIIIISIIAAFTIPNYTKTITKADERNMIANLMTMRVAVKMYTLDGMAMGAWNNLSTINSNLSISVMDPKFNKTFPDVTLGYYVCGTNSDGTNGCTAAHPSGWAIQFHDEHSSGLLHCSAGTCPSCPAQPGNCG